MAVADATPAWRIERGVIYLDPSDLAFPVGFNPLNHVAVDHRPLVAAHIVAAFQHIWGNSWGPRLEYILTNALRLLLDAPGSTLLGLPRLLADEDYSKKMTIRLSLVLCLPIGAGASPFDALSAGRSGTASCVRCMGIP